MKRLNPKKQTPLFLIGMLRAHLKHLEDKRPLQILNALDEKLTDIDDNNNLIISLYQK